jgi:hypothetical protein
MKFDPSTHTHIQTLKDGRVISKSHNGFRYYIADKKGTTRVTEEYYKHAKELVA